MYEFLPNLRVIHLVRLHLGSDFQSRDLGLACGACGGLALLEVP